MTPNELAKCADLYVIDGFGRTVCGMIWERDRVLDAWTQDHRFDFDSAEAAAFVARLTTHVKLEEIWDSGDGRDAIDVVCLDGKPIAVVHEEGYDDFRHDVVVLDIAALDEIVAAAWSFQKREFQPIKAFDADAALPDDFKVQVDFEGAAAPGM